MIVNQSKKYWFEVIKSGMAGEYGEKWIQAAAIIVNGKIRYHARHHLILQELNNTKFYGPQSFGPASKYQIGEQGFMLQDGSFIDRVEAYKLALQNGQYRGAGSVTGKLHSEDLWDI